MKKAKDLMEIGMYEEAIVILDMEIMDNPKNAEAHFLLGKAYLHSNQTEKAKVSFSRSIIIENKNKDLVVNEYLELALLSIEEGKSREFGFALFSQVIDYDPGAKKRIAQELLRTAEGLSNIRTKNLCLKEAIKYLDKDRDEELIKKIEAELIKDTIIWRYFNAIILNDVTTISTMAVEPISMDVESWEIISVSEEKIEPTSLPEMNRLELELRKKVEESVGITLDAKDALLDAEYERDQARTSTARRVAQNKVKELQATYDEIYATHIMLQTDYNEAKAATAREEQITSFSLGAGDISNIRDLTGEVHSMEVEVKVVGKEGTKNYKLYLKMYGLKDEVLNVGRRGQWKIIKFELIS